MKKLIAMLLIATLLTSCSMLSSDDFDSIEFPTVEPKAMYIDGVEVTKVTSGFEGSYVGVYTFDALLNSDLIVIGEFVEEKSEFDYVYDDYFKRDVIFGASTFGELRVLEVLQGDIEVGDTVTVWQQYSFDKERGALISFDDRTPIHIGDRWIYCLNYDEDAKAYAPRWKSGRFPLPNKETIQIMQKFFEGVDKIKSEKWLKDKIDEDLTKQFQDGDKSLWEFAGEADEQGEYTVALPIFENVVYRLNMEEVAKQTDMIVEVCKIYDKIETSALGVLSRYDLNFVIYFQLLDHFNLPSYDWENPGRGFDAKLLEIMEQQNG